MIQVLLRRGNINDQLIYGKCSVSLAIREMKIKTTGDNTFPVRMATIKKQKIANTSKQVKFFLHCWWDSNVTFSFLRHNI